MNNFQWNEFFILEELQPCPCCQSEQRRMGTCPVCGWELDCQQDDLELEQARLNFQTFGTINPEKLIGGQKEDAEF